MRIIITGGTGLIGRRLVEHLAAAQQHEIIVLTRDTNGKQSTSGVQLRAWDALSSQGWLDLINQDTIIVNLAGENIANWRWTLTHRRVVLQSRIATSRAITQAIQQAKEKPRALLQASAVGYYGSRGELSIGEQTTPGEGWLAELSKLWESETQPVEAEGVRRVVMRFSSVLDTSGGFLPPMLLASRLGISRFGHGRQWIPWIHYQDAAGIIQHLIDCENISGAVNVTSPEPITNAQFFQTVARVRFALPILPMSAFKLRLLLGEMSSTLLNSQRVFTPKLADYAFKFPHLQDALTDLLKQYR